MLAGEGVPPARGTLIRRIAMLRDNDEVSERPWSRPRRLLAASFLLGVAAGVMTLRGPARGAEDKPSGATRRETPVVSGPPRDPSVRVVNGAGAKPTLAWPGCRRRGRSSGLRPREHVGPGRVPTRRNVPPSRDGSLRQADQGGRSRRVSDDPEGEIRSRRRGRNG